MVWVGAAAASVGGSETRGRMGGEGMDRDGWEREAAAGWGRRGGNGGAIVVDLDRGEGEREVAVGVF